MITANTRILHRALSMLVLNAMDAMPNSEACCVANAARRWQGDPPGFGYGIGVDARRMRAHLHAVLHEHADAIAVPPSPQPRPRSPSPESRRHLLRLGLPATDAVAGIAGTPASRLEDVTPLLASYSGTYAPSPSSPGFRRNPPRSSRARTPSWPHSRGAPTTPKSPPWPASPSLRPRRPSPSPTPPAPMTAPRSTPRPRSPA